MEMTFSIGFNKAAQLHIETGHSQQVGAVRDMLAEAFYSSFHIFNPITGIEELQPSNQNRRFQVTLNKRLSDTIRNENAPSEEILKEVIGGYLRKTCKVWDQEGCAFTPPQVC